MVEYINICSTHELHIASTGNGAVTMQQSSISPKFVNISVGRSTRVYNICVSDQLTVVTAIGSHFISMDSKQLSSCPQVGNILNGGGNSVFYVCATHAIDAKLYFKGPLNRTEITNFASIQKWV